MTRWRELHQQHLSLKDRCGSAFAAEIRRRLHRLAEHDHAQGTLPNRFTYKRDHQQHSYFIAAPEASERRHWSEPLKGLRPGLEEARLTVLARIDTRRLSLQQATVMVEGRSTGGSSWTLAAHLDEEPMGDGACSHALLHCHVGESLDSAPKIRVPMPAVEPGDVLDWAICQVIDGWDPAPWEGSP